MITHFPFSLQPFALFKLHCTFYTSTLTLRLSRQCYKYQNDWRKCSPPKNIHIYIYIHMHSSSMKDVNKQYSNSLKMRRFQCLKTFFKNRCAAGWISLLSRTMWGMCAVCGRPESSHRRRAHRCGPHSEMKKRKEKKMLRDCGSCSFGNAQTNCFPKLKQRN